MKLQELKEKSIDELNSLIVDTKKQLFDLRLQKSLQKLENTATTIPERNLLPVCFLIF